jgi:hypothetical protein
MAAGRWKKGDLDLDCDVLGSYWDEVRIGVNFCLLGIVNSMPQP